MIENYLKIKLRLKETDCKKTCSCWDHKIKYTCSMRFSLKLDTYFLICCFWQWIGFKLMTFSSFSGLLGALFLLLLQCILPVDVFTLNLKFIFRPHIYLHAYILINLHIWCYMSMSSDLLQAVTYCIVVLRLKDTWDQFTPYLH